jgi:hypothetical protein
VIVYRKKYATPRPPAALSAHPIGEDMPMTTTTQTGPAPEEYLDRWTPEWRLLWIMRYEQWSWDWAALLVDVEPEEYQSSWTIAQFARVRWLRIPGKHRNRDSARGAFEDLTATRH